MHYASHKVSGHNYGVAWKPAIATMPLATTRNAISETRNVLYNRENKVRRCRHCQSFTYSLISQVLIPSLRVITGLHSNANWNFTDHVSLHLKNFSELYIPRISAFVNNLNNILQNKGNLNGHSKLRSYLNTICTITYSSKWCESISGFPLFYATWMNLLRDKRKFNTWPSQTRTSLSFLDYRTSWKIRGAKFSRLIATSALAK